MKKSGDGDVEDIKSSTEDSQKILEKLPPSIMPNEVENLEDN
jgi:hypothetical protein